MPNRNRRRRNYDYPNVIIASPISSPVVSPVASPISSTITTVESVTLGEHSERIIQRLKSSNKSYKQINDRFMNYNKKIKQILLLKAREVEKLNKQLSSNKVAIKLYQDKIKELMGKIENYKKTISECLSRILIISDWIEWMDDNDDMTKTYKKLMNLIIEDLQELQF